MENDYSYSVHSDILNGDVDIYPMFDKDAVTCKYYYNDDKELRFPTIDDETIFWNRFEECVVSFLINIRMMESFLFREYLKE